MNKRVLIVVVIVILLIGAAVAYVLLRPVDDSTVSQSTSSSQTSPSTSSGTESDVNQPGAYIDYRDGAIEGTPGTKLLFFHASWCPQCREIETSIKQDGLPDNVTVFKVDYDTNQTLRQKYGVTIQTTFVKVDDAGNKIASYVAYEEPRFSTVERELLQ